MDVPCLDTEPILDDYLEGFMEAFAILSPSRAIGFQAPSAIALAELSAYISLEEIELDERDRFVRFLRAIDSEFLAFYAERSKGNP